MGILQEFKTFALKGNVVDMAIGIVVGAAFGKIVSSLVSDVIMPPIGLLLGNVDFSRLSVPLKYGADGSPLVALRYGAFINTVIDFVIVAFAIFLLVQQMNRLTKKKEAAPPQPATKDCPYCLSSVPAKATRCAHCTSQLEIA